MNHTRSVPCHCCTQRRAENVSFNDTDKQQLTPYKGNQPACLVAPGTTVQEIPGQIALASHVRTDTDAWEVAHKSGDAATLARFRDAGEYLPDRDLPWAGQARTRFLLAGVILVRGPAPCPVSPTMPRAFRPRYATPELSPANTALSRSRRCQRGGDCATCSARLTCSEPWRTLRSGAATRDTPPCCSVLAGARARRGATRRGTTFWITPRTVPVPQVPRHRNRVQMTCGAGDKGITPLPRLSVHAGR